MSYQFEGQRFASLEAWKRAFPAYRSYPELVKSGADTVQKLEAAIAERARRYRQSTLAGARRSKELNPPPLFRCKKRKP